MLPRNVSPKCWRCASRILRSPSAIAADHRQPLARTLTTPKANFSTRAHTRLSLARPSIQKNINGKSLTPKRHRSSQFEPLTPPSPAGLGKPTAAKTYRRTRKWLRRLLQLALATGLLGAADTYFYDACLTRSVRTFYTGLLIALDYNLNFRPDPWVGDSVADLHARSAQRVFELLRANGGLYLKIGQAIAMQSAILPPEFQRMFARMFDDAPQNAWSEVERVIREDFGKSVEEVFGVGFGGERTAGEGVMERTARASASVAQVHWARLADGREVAVKIQKREIANQVGWDLWAFKVVSRVYSAWFDLPLYHLVPYVCDRLMAETDFRIEAENGRKMRELIQGEKRLRGRVYVPETYPELSSQRVMTAEWIEGVRLWDKDGITGTWHGGWRKGSPGAGGIQVEAPSRLMHTSPPNTNPLDEQLKPPRDAWKGASHSGGLGLALKPVMQTMVDLFSAQMFLWGLVHCDPHPGNILIRRLPSGRPELVLLDHGLYITLPPTFRRSYARVWRSLLTFDNTTLARITRDEWGITAPPDVFASATLMRPYTGGDQQVLTHLNASLEGDKSPRERQFALQQHLRSSIRGILANQDKFPQELIFLARNLRIVQGNNQRLGSPVNRVKIIGYWASRALAEDPEASSRFGAEFASHALFRLALLGSDVLWWWARARQLLGWGGGMEEELERGMRRVVGGLGVELQHGVFDG